MLFLSSAPPNSFDVPLLLIKSKAPDTKEQTHLSEGDQGRKITLAVKAPLLPLFCDFPASWGRGERSRRTHKCEDEEQLVKMVDDKQKQRDAACPLGGFTSVCKHGSCCIGIHHSGVQDVDPNCKDPKCIKSFCWLTRCELVETCWAEEAAKTMEGTLEDSGCLSVNFKGWGELA